MPAATKKYILYAEDDVDDQDFLRETLSHLASELELVCVSNGLELVQFLDALQPEDYYPCFIILDVNMPVWDGIKTLQAIKSHREWNSLSVVMFTTSNGKKDGELAIREGAAEFITKPINDADLKRVTERFASYCLRQPERKKQRA